MQLVKLLWIVALASLYGVLTDALPVMIGGEYSGGRVAHSLRDDFQSNSEDMDEGFCMPVKVDNAGKPDNIECGSYEPLWTMSQLMGRKSLDIVLPKDQYTKLE